MAKEYEETIKRCEKQIRREEAAIAHSKAQYEIMDSWKKIKIYRSCIREAKAIVAVLRERGERYS